MKAIIGGFLLVSAIIWSLWSLSAKEDCEQVGRFVAPINVVTWVIREVSENWVERDTRLDMLVWSAEVREFSEKMIGRTFYSKSLVCANWSKK